MKQICLPLSFLAALALLAAPVSFLKADDAKTPAPAVSEKMALEGFKKAVLEIKAMQKPKDPKDPMGPIMQLKPMMAKVREVKTAGLPADLKTAWDNSLVKMEEMADIFKDLPDKKEEVADWAKKKFSDPAMQEKMKKLSKEGKESSQKLKEVAKKYGVEVPD